MPLSMLTSMTVLWGLFLAAVVLLPLAYFALREREDADSKPEVAKRAGKRTGSAIGGLTGVVIALVVGLVGGAYQALGGLQPLAMLVLDFVFANPELSANVAITALAGGVLAGILKMSVAQFLLLAFVITAIGAALAAYGYTSSTNAGLAREREDGETETELMD